MGACHVDLGAAYLGAYPGVGAYHSTGQNSYLGAYPGVGTYAGDYGSMKFSKDPIIMENRVITKIKCA